MLAYINSNRPHEMVIHTVPTLFWQFRRLIYRHGERLIMLKNKLNNLWIKWYIVILFTLRKALVARWRVNIKFGTWKTGTDLA